MLAGGITLALLVLPVVIIVAREAIRAVPLVDPRRIAGARRHAVADDLEAGAARLDCRHRDRRHPRALARDRRDRPACWSSAPPSIRASTPTGSDSAFTALPIQIFAWTQDPNREFVDLAAAAILVMMIVLLLMNSVAIFLRNRYEQKW